MRLLLLFIWMYFCYCYEENIALHTVNLAQATYTVSNVDEWNCYTCDPSIKLEYIVEHHGAKALQGFDSYTNTIFTAFRGSSNILNWIDNIQISKISPYNDTSINVEKGFYKAYEYLKDDLFNNIPTLVSKYNTNQVSITGHSLGAAMATLMVYDISNFYSNYKITFFYTFGSPRVGNSEFVASFHSFNIPSYRITHYYDIVPHVPEEFMGYSHISNEIWYNEENNHYTICNDNEEEDNSCSNSCAPTHCTSVSDHLYYLNVSMGSGE